MELTEPQKACLLAIMNNPDLGTSASDSFRP